MTRSLLRYISPVLFCLPVLLHGHEEEMEKPRDGNFSVPSVTTMGPLVSFGQLIIGEKALLAELSGTYIHFRHGYDNIIAPDVIYGIRDDLSIVLAVPFTVRSHVGSAHSSGINDTIVQLEYAYFASATRDYALQGTIVGNVQFPTGSSSKDPPTGTGSYSYFFGTTFSFLSVNWYAFVSPGANLTTQHHGTKFGNSYLYQAGIARYIKPLSPPGWIFDLMLEFDGTYQTKSKFHNILDQDSGGNTILMTPSIWLSSKHCIIQWGVSIPVVQKLHGRQDKLRYAIDYSLGIAVQF